MGVDSQNRYAAPHVHNLTAKILRTAYPTGKFANDMLEEALLTRRTIEGIALAFAHRFMEDEGFDPLAFLDKCSPDVDSYPLSELWDGNNGELPTNKTQL